MLYAALGTVLWWAVFIYVFRRDRRRIRNGALFLLAAHSTITLLLEVLATVFPFGIIAVLGLTILLIPGIITLAVVMIGNGLTMARKEGRSLGNALSLVAGVALLAAPAVSFVLISTLHPVGLGIGMLIGLVSLHLGLAFLVFLSASWLYLMFPRRFATDGIIVLGSQLIRGRIPKLLRSRLDRAVAARNEVLAMGRDPLLVPSGGQGPDEARAEGEAMADYLREEAGVPGERVVAETEARTTEENLTLSHRILDDAGHRGPYLIATSRYHAFRAALIARRLGYADEAVGGPTAAYFVPSAMLREFIAVMTYRRGWNLLALVPSLGLTAIVVLAALRQI